MADSDDAEDAEDALSFAPPRADDGAEDGDEPASADAEETKKKFRKPSGPAPLDDEGFAMSWDADEGVWIETVGVGEAAAQLTDQWIETRMAQVKMHLEKLQREGGVHGTALFSYDELDDCKSALTYALAGEIMMASASASFIVHRAHAKRARWPTAACPTKSHTMVTLKRFW